jgi:hypothetical protein
MLNRTSILLLFIITFTLFITNIHGELDDTSSDLEDSNFDERTWEAKEEDFELDKRRTQTIPTGNTKVIINRLIGRWTDDSIASSQTTKSNYVKLPGVASARIDIQSPINRNNRRYFNVQAQYGTATYATVLIPGDAILGKHTIRKAFLESMKSGTTWIFVTTGKKGQPWKAQQDG